MLHSSRAFQARRRLDGGAANMPAARGTRFGSVLLLRGVCTSGSAARTARAPRERTGGEFLCWATFQHSRREVSSVGAHGSAPIPRLSAIAPGIPLLRASPLSAPKPARVHHWVGKCSQYLQDHFRLSPRPNSSVPPLCHHTLLLAPPPPPVTQRPRGRTLE